MSDFGYFSSYLQTKKIVWKRGDAIFPGSEFLLNSLGQI